MANGFHEVAAAAGNGGGNAPAAHAPKKPSKPDLQAASDNGAKNNDDVTSLTNLVFDIERVEAGMTVQLRRNGVLVASVFSASGGTVSLRDAGPIPVGAYQYTARLVNTSGLSSDDSPSLRVDVVAGTAPPPARPAAPDLEAASDSGAAADDNLTNASAPSFTVSGVSSGATVRLMRDGVVVATGIATSSSITLVDSVARADGTYSYSAVVVDSVGQISPISAALSVTFDTAAPAAVSVDLQAASDSGASDGDNLTSAGLHMFDLVGVDASSMVELMRDGEVIASGMGSSLMFDSAALADGAYTYTARQTDAAGNASAIAGSLVVTIDTTAPDAPVLDLQAGSDSGASDSDNLTSSGGLVFDISGAEAGAMVELLRDGFAIASGVASGASMTLSDPESLNDGAHVYTVRQTDAAGNVSLASGGVSVTIDRTAPATMTLDLQAGSDSGLSDGDNVTSSTSLVFDLGNVEAGAVVELLRDGSVVAVADGGTISDTVGEGVHHYTIRQTDAAGNVSVTSDDLAVTVDMTPPAAPTLSLSSDTGIAGDGVTRDRRPFFAVSGTEAGAMVRLLDENGNVLATVSATGSETLIQPDALLTPGMHSFSVHQIDAAGHASDASGAVSVKVINALASSDYDGDGVSDVAVYNTGNWTIILSSTGEVRGETLGAAGYVPVPGDYDGDGKTDLATYRPSSRAFTIVPSSDPEATRFQFLGTANQIPVCADYDGDGKTDVAVYNNSTGVFTISRSTGGTITRTISGITNALPVPADYDGDGKADPAVYDSATGNWTILRSTTGTTLTTHFGNAGDQPITGDFDGDGFDDLAVFASATNQFSAFASSGGTITATVGSAGDLPLAADFDGDHKSDFAAYSRAEALLSIFRSSGGTDEIGIGMAGGVDQPLPLSPLLARVDVLGF